VALATKPGEWLDVVLWWRATQPSLAARPPLAVSLKLWGLAGTGEGEEVYLAAQKDDWPVGGLLLTPDWPLEKTLRYPMRLWLPDDLPAGQYWLDVEVYDPETMAPLLRKDEQGHAVPLGSVTVTAQP
jgi:hypothetical protein